MRLARGLRPAVAAQWTLRTRTRRTTRAAQSPCDRPTAAAAAIDRVVVPARMVGDEAHPDDRTRTPLTRGGHSRQQRAFVGGVALFRIGKDEHVVHVAPDQKIG